MDDALSLAKAAEAAKARMKQIDALLSDDSKNENTSSNTTNTRTNSDNSSSINDTSSSKPPQNLTPDEEVEWWKNKISALSRPAVAIGDENDDSPIIVPFQQKAESKCEGKIDDNNHKSYSYKMDKK